jgi:recombination associated protein RdgC
MWFRNLQLYRLPQPWAITAPALAEQLARLQFQRCGSQSTESRGFIPPRPNSELVLNLAGQWLIALSVEKRLLPTTVVKQELADRVELIEAEQGYRPGRKQLREMKEAITQELLPRAFTARRTLYAWIDPESGWLAIDAPSRSKAEIMIEALSKALDELPLTLPRSVVPPIRAMGDWLAGAEAPSGFTIDQDCELRAIDEERAAIRYVRHNLDTDEIRRHIAHGKQATRLALTFDQRMSFVLTEQLEIKRLAFLDVIKEQLGDSRDAIEQFDADFSLMSGELQRLLPALFEVLGGEE